MRRPLIPDDLVKWKNSIPTDVLPEIYHVGCNYEATRCQFGCCPRLGGYDIVIRCMCNAKALLIFNDDGHCTGPATTIEWLGRYFHIEVAESLYRLVDSSDGARCYTTLVEVNQQETAAPAKAQPRAAAFMDLLNWLTEASSCFGKFQLRHKTCGELLRKDPAPRLYGQVRFAHNQTADFWCRCRTHRAKMPMPINDRLFLDFINNEIVFEPL